MMFTLLVILMHIHRLVLLSLYLKVTDVDLSFKPSKCVPFLFDGSKVLPHGVSLKGYKQANDSPYYRSPYSYRCAL